MPLTTTLTLGHSPDPDDAFMFYPLATGRIESRGYSFEHILQDIQTLNERAEREELDITAISLHQYPFVADKYALTSCGCSMGDGYGPMIVSRTPMTVKELREKSIAVPGLRTTAFLALNLLLGRGGFEHQVIMFDRILEHVAAGRADAGLIIHEGQLTFARERLHLVVDLGKWWKETSGLPLPLGGNCIRRSLGLPVMTEVASLLKESIEFAINHREEGVAHAMKFARDMGRELTDRFIGMYVNHWTVDFGEVGRKAVTELLRRAHAAGMTPSVTELEFVG